MGLKRFVKKITAPIKNLNVKILEHGKTTITSIQDPKKLFSARGIKENIKGSIALIGDAVSGVNELAVGLNPLDHQLEKFNKKGKSRGGIGRYLGGLGETARKKPVSTTLAVYGAVNLLSSLGSGSASQAGNIAGRAGDISGASSVNLIKDAGSFIGSRAMDSPSSWISSITQKVGSTVSGYATETATAIAGTGATALVNNIADNETVNSDSPITPIQAGMFGGNNFIMFLALGSVISIIAMIYDKKGK